MRFYFYLVLLSILDIVVGFVEQTLELSEDSTSPVSVCISHKEGDIEDTLSLEIDQVEGSAGDDCLYYYIDEGNYMITFSCRSQ